MKSKIFKALERGFADYGWLKANYSFSFANYRNPQKEHFGALRVLNDDFIQGGAGFGEHPHNNMEIISIPLSGSLKHKDSMSNTWIPLETGEVQVMSAGNGIQHAEKNGASNELLNLFQIWIIPDKMHIEPTYGQKIFEASKRKNTLQVLVHSYKDGIEDVLSIHQDAQISRIDLTKGNSFDYTLRSANHGVYAMLISGQIEIDNSLLEARDAMGIWHTDSCNIASHEDAEILLIEVPMVF
ncbi:pirin family protein [Lutimonas sp.]|uniref:pirin family protein n=1 Tax=Lutimonas sp. TaxID=1872403 RepID=UPI003D9BC404